MTGHDTRRQRGFTFVELMVTLALLGVIAAAALPLFEVVSTRTRESELRQALRVIRTALDAYKVAADQGQIARETGSSGYPPSLEILEKGVDLATSTPNAVTADGRRALTRIVFLRQVPRDPFNMDPNLPAVQTWRLRAYGSPPDSPQAGDDVFDVSSSSNRVGLNGIPYSEW